MPDEDRKYDLEAVAAVLTEITDRAVHEICCGRRPVVSVTALDPDPQGARSAPRRAPHDQLLSDVLQIAGTAPRTPTAGAVSLGMMYACKDLIAGFCRREEEALSSLRWTGQAKLPEPLSSVNPGQVWAQPAVWGHHLKYALKGLAQLCAESGLMPDGSHDPSQIKEGAMDPVEARARQSALRLLCMRVTEVTLDESMVSFMNESVKTS